MQKTKILFASAIALTLSLTAGTGCGSKVSVEEGKAKIEELASKGVPEREMSDIKMYVFQMETAKKTGNNSVFRTYQDSLTRALGLFESKMSALLENSGPFMDSVRRACDDKIAGLKGLHKETAEKGKGAIDSLMKIESQKLYARSRLETWSLEIDTLVTLQKLADSLRKDFVGIWVMELESPDPNYTVVERNEIHMKPDGSLFIMEGKKGRGRDGTAEEWLFHTFGTWDLLGDVAHHYITREKRLRQDFQGIDPQTGKMRKKSEPAYDSTVAKGTKDRYAAWESLNKDYKRFPIKK